MILRITTHAHGIEQDVLILRDVWGNVRKMLTLPSQ